ncbi:MAG: GlsB/YeaQ/YmgE family stress response membrane protein [Pleurocapsa minor GSE-CHR-MK-17-07R]|nr:GlsB/YeaQ/YmgE family stress response membrane protein [Pleurocapsa minor GSE-CHR-MK 17-07R]
MGDFINTLIASPFICLGWIIVGIIAGSLARRLLGNSNRPLLEDLILGLIGAFLGGLLASLLGIGRPDGGITLVIVNLAIAVVGAIVVLVVVRALRRA